MKLPKDMSVKHKFIKIIKLDDNQVNIIITRSWDNQLTETNLGKACTICGSTPAMLHVRSVKDVRGKWISKTLIFVQWKGGILSKQVPLCKYNHTLFTNKLTTSDISIIRKYR